MYREGRKERWEGLVYYNAPSPIAGFIIIGIVRIAIVLVRKKDYKSQHVTDCQG